MRVRAVANGNIIDLPEDSSLIAAGIYVPVEEGEEQPSAAPPPSPAPAAPTPARDAALISPEGPLMTTAHAAPLTEPKAARAPAKAKPAAKAAKAKRRR